MFYDMNGICKFAKVSFDEVAELFNNVYDAHVKGDDFKAVSHKVNLMARGIDGGLGFTSADDVLAPNAHTDYGGFPGYFNTHEFFEKVKEKVYEINSNNA